MSKKISFSAKFFEDYEEALKGGLHYSEEALLHILKAFKSEVSSSLDACWEYDKENVGFLFHKGFRQADVIPKAYLRKFNSDRKCFFEELEDLSLDVVIWKMLQNAPKFWEVMERLQKKK